VTAAGSPGGGNRSDGPVESLARIRPGPAEHRGHRSPAPPG